MNNGLTSQFSGLLFYPSKHAEGNEKQADDKHRSMNLRRGSRRSVGITKYFRDQRSKDALTSQLRSEFA